MNYQPFSKITGGNLFHLMNKSNIPLMKLDKNSAVLLKGYWVDGRLYSRGTVMPMTEDTCVVALTEGSVTLEFEKVDPIDPRRQFWKEGDTRNVGQGRIGKVKVFAGLFLYSGGGGGSYYSAANNEVFWCSVQEGRDRAAADDVPFVRYDGLRWTNDPDLVDERKVAQRFFDEAKALSAKEAVSANAETA